MSEMSGDSVVILSSDLIAKITQEYFNKTLFKQRVEIVDLKPTEDGYMFSVAFVESARVTGIDKPPTAVALVSTVVDSVVVNPQLVEDTQPQRASNGRFMKVK